VLKITTVREKTKSVRVHLCGQFTGEYVPELEKVLTESTDAGNVALDLSNVTFVDREAMVFLCGAKSRDVLIENIPSYVTRWIEQEGRCGISAALHRLFGRRSSDSEPSEK
jgi:anti-anti-sigma regulatory factor